MPLVKPSYYEWREAVETVVTALPDEDPIANLVEALADAQLTAFVCDRATGRDDKTPAAYWKRIKLELMNTPGQLWQSYDQVDAQNREKYSPRDTEWEKRKDLKWFRLYWTYLEDSEDNQDDDDTSFDLFKGRGKFATPHPHGLGYPHTSEGPIRIPRAQLNALLKQQSSLSGIEGATSRRGRKKEFRDEIIFPILDVLARENGGINAYNYTLAQALVSIIEKQIASGEINLKEAPSEDYASKSIVPGWKAARQSQNAEAK